MKNISTVFARALEAALPADQLVRVAAELAAVAAGSTAELAEFFDSPAVPAESKFAALDALAGQLQLESVNTLKLIAEQRAFGQIGAISQAVQAAADRAAGIQEVLVESATPLAEPAQKQLADALAARLGKQIRLVTAEDPALLGGVRVRIGDEVIDASVRGQLSQLVAALR